MENNLIFIHHKKITLFMLVKMFGLIITIDA